jgi:hypothetical protein
VRAFPELNFHISNDQFGDAADICTLADTQLGIRLCYLLTSVATPDFCPPLPNNAKGAARMCLQRNALTIAILAIGVFATIHQQYLISLTTDFLRCARF